MQPKAANDDIEFLTQKLSGSGVAAKVNCVKNCKELLKIIPKLTLQHK